MKKREDLIYHRRGIYGIQNINTGETYVGQTTNNFGDRWDSHKALLRANKHYNKNLQEAWNACGELAFDFLVLDECSIEEIDNREQYFVAQYASQGLAYNITAGGAGTTFSGKHLPDDVKKKIGAKNKVHATGKKASDETKKKMSDSHKGVLHGPMSAEQKELLRKSHQEYYEKNPQKLTIENVKEIRRLHSEGQSYASIARQFNVSATCVSDICNYKRWKQI